MVRTMTNKQEIQELIERLENILDDFYDDNGVNPSDAKELLEDSKYILQEYQKLISFQKENSSEVYNCSNCKPVIDRVGEADLIEQMHRN